VNLRNGQQVTVRILEPADEKNLLQFMKNLPARERLYFRDDVTDQTVIHGWCHDIRLDRIIPVLAVREDEIIASWSLHMREHGWTRHLANIRGIVHPNYRQFGLATIIIYELLSLAQELELERVVIELVSPQRRLLRHFQSLGFEVVSVLKDWIKDKKGQYHDLQMLSMKIEPAWRRMEELILDYGTHGG
jgi:GNAT superfamily N-acetyltransferase